MRVGMYASAHQYGSHLRPIWEKLEDNEQWAWITGHANMFPRIESPDLWLAASIRDFNKIMELRKVTRVYMEHGTGLQSHSQNALLHMTEADLVMVPNEFTKRDILNLCQKHRYEMRRMEVVGTPKMDYLRTIPQPKNGVIGISFHWTGAGQNFFVWKDALKRLAKTYTLLGHSHPHIWPKMKHEWAHLGIEPVETFRELVGRAEVYMCDHSSTLYEWAALNRPVIILDRQNSQEKLKSSGLLYSSFEQIGPKALPNNLAETLELMQGDNELKEFYQRRRDEMTWKLYPHLGESSELGLRMIREVYGDS